MDHHCDWKKVVGDYKKEFDEEPEKDGTLRFASREEAIKFFQQQAQKGHQFLANERGTDFYVFSAGDKSCIKAPYIKLKISLKTHCGKIQPISKHKQDLCS